MNKSVVSVVAVVLMLATLSWLYYDRNRQEHLTFSQVQEDLKEKNAQTLQQQRVDKEMRVNSDSVDWMNALMENTPDSYRLYLESHTNGVHAEDAREMLEVFGRTRIVVPKDSNHYATLKADSLKQKDSDTETKNVEPQVEPDTIH